MVTIRSAAACHQFVMRHHQDGAAAFAVDLIEQTENLLAGGGVEISGGFVAQQHYRLEDQRPGYGDALPLAAGELVRPVRGALRQTGPLQQRAGAAHGLVPGNSLQPQRQGNILERGERGQKVEGLEDHSDLLAAQAGAGIVAQLRRETPATFTVPELGWSRPQMRLSTVVLPEPDGPMSATRSPAATRRLRSRSALTLPSIP